MITDTVEAAKLKIGVESDEVLTADKNLKKLSETVDKTGAEGKGKLKTLEESFSGIASVIPKITGGITGVGLAMSKAFDLGEEGAGLDYAADKFDNLSRSIGTTSDVLINDLRAATGGIVDDAGLISLANDVIGLGFVKTAEQATRLSVVAGQLNMDMNQLSLTLANKGTQRFDQLGVAVEGFDEKLQKLKDSGLSDNDAFMEAFLQQSEEQLEKVGSVLDQDVAKFQRLDATLKNIADTGKQELAPFLANAAEGLDLLLTMNGKINAAFTEQAIYIRDNTSSYDEYIQEVLQAARAGHLITEQQRRYILETYEAGNASDEYAAKLDSLGISIDISSQTTYRATKATSGWTDETYAAYRGISLLKDATDDAEVSIKDLVPALSDAKTLMGEYTEMLMFTQAATNLNSDEAILLAEKMGLIDEDTRIAMEALGELKKQYEDNLLTTEEYTDRVNTLNDAIMRMQSKSITLTTEFTEIYTRIENTRGETGGYGGMEEQERALGGTVFSGTPYLTGERGPEPFIPNTDGQIITNDDLVRALTGMRNNGVVIEAGAIVVQAQNNLDVPFVVDEIFRQVQEKLI